MSRVKDLKRRAKHVNGFRHTFAPQQTQRPPLQQQIDQIFAGLGKLADLLAELDLQIEFTMRQIQMKRAVPGSIITSTDGKPQYETLNLLQLYATQREAFAQFLMKERHATLEAQRIADSGGQNGTGTGAAPAPAKSGSGTGTDAATGPSVIADFSAKVN